MRTGDQIDPAAGPRNNAVTAQALLTSGLYLLLISRRYGDPD